MARSRFAQRASVFAYCFASACSFKAADQADTPTNETGNGASNPPDISGPGDGGQTGNGGGSTGGARTPKTNPGGAVATPDGGGGSGSGGSSGGGSGGGEPGIGLGAPAVDGSTEEDAAGDRGFAGEPAIPPADIVPDPTQAACDLDGSCVSKCTDQTAICAVQALGIACELGGFVGASVPVACGQRALIGTACCGECGCVPVEVFFDGGQCWEGVPACNLDQFTNKFFDPHAPETSASTYSGPTSPGFYLGVAIPPGVGGSDQGNETPPQGGQGGETEGGSAGAVSDPL